MNKRRYILWAALLASAALWLSQPEGGYALQPGEAELSTVSLGKLEIGMSVRDGSGATGKVTKFIRRDVGARSAELAVVAWDENVQAASPLSALQPIDAGSVQVANR